MSVSMGIAVVPANDNGQWVIPCDICKMNGNGGWMRFYSQNEKLFNPVYTISYYHLFCSMSVMKGYK